MQPSLSRSDLVVVEGALEDDRVHVLAVHVGVGARLGFVAGLHDDVDDLAQRIEQVHEDVEEPIGGDRGRQDGHLVAGLGVAIDVAAVALARDHVEPDRRANGIGQQEVAVAADAEVGVELFLAEIVEGRAWHTGWIVAKDTLKEALDETHGKDSPPKPHRTKGMFR